MGVWTSYKLAQFKQLNIFQNADEKQFEVVSYHINSALFTKIKKGNAVKP